MARSGPALIGPGAGGPEAAAVARGAVAAYDDELPSAVLADVLLLVTELVTNTGGAAHEASGTRVWFEIEFEQ